jgi:hypothetical protein
MVDGVLDMTVKVTIGAFPGAKWPVNINPEGWFNLDHNLIKTKGYEFIKGICPMAYPVFFVLIHLAKG